MHRRQLLHFGLGSALLVACGGRRGSASPADARLEPTVAVDDGDADLDEGAPFPGTCDPTAENIEGPFFKPGAPARSTLVRPADDGQRLALGGLVLGADCTPLAGANLEVWHADARGAYDNDNDGYHFRGALRTGADGRWSLRTIVPGRYLNGRRFRPRHIHVKLSAPGHAELTTQLYFDGDPYNRGDAFFIPSLVMANVGRGRAGFDFVLAGA
jgi:protocatechuate 3,4-dioxygenase beta subunit